MDVDSIQTLPLPPQSSCCCSESRAYLSVCCRLELSTMNSNAVPTAAEVAAAAASAAAAHRAASLARNAAKAAVDAAAKMGTPDTAAAAAAATAVARIQEDISADISAKSAAIATAAAGNVPVGTLKLTRRQRVRYLVYLGSRFRHGVNIYLAKTTREGRPEGGEEGEGEAERCRANCGFSAQEEKVSSASS